MSKVMLIINPHSGKMKARSKLVDIINRFTVSGHDVSVFPTNKQFDATRFVESKSENFDVIVCCGGDGTLSEVIDGIMKVESKKPLGYIPMGTTNDFAATFKIPKNIDEAITNIINGDIFQFDIGKFNDKHFAYIASFGMFTESSYKTSQELKKVFGHFAYILEGAANIGSIPNFKLKIEHDGAIVEGDFVFCAISNSTSIGGILKLPTESVSLDDGLVEVLLIRNPNNRFKLRDVFLGLAKNKFDKNYVEFFSTSKLSISSESDISWCLDGEFGGLSKQVNITCLPKAVSLIKRTDTAG
jgi:YegS/Rv2252/BmrU family lipid kinase